MAMATKPKYHQPVQKLIYSKESSMSINSQSTADPAIMGLFKSSSSLARRIRQTEPETKNSLQSSAALIMTQSDIKPPKMATMKSSVPSAMKDILIRNIIHDYSNIDTNEATYKILSELKKEKRMQNMDLLEDYEEWKEAEVKKSEDEVKEKVSNLEKTLKDTQDEIYSKFTMKDEDLITQNQNDINNITAFYQNVINTRDNNIEDTKKQLMIRLSDCFNLVKLKIIELAKNLDLTGFLLEEEIAKIKDEKTDYITRLINCKKSLYTRIIQEIKDSEKEIVEKSKEDLKEFILRWKNTKLNNYLRILKEKLNSEEIVDNADRYELIEKLKQDQIEIYEKRRILIFDQIFNLKYEQINRKTMAMKKNSLEEIEKKADDCYDRNFKILQENSNLIQQKSLEFIEQFKGEVASVSYDFTKDNHNEKKYNDYDDVDSIDGLLTKEIDPILNTNSEARKNYLIEINKYIEAYDDYTQKVSEKIIEIFTTIGKCYDEHLKKIAIGDRNYLISLAKAADDDEEIRNEKEANLKKVLVEMRNCVNNEELNNNLTASFGIMDELEKQYRAYFQNVEDLFNSHEGLLKNTYHDQEKNILKIFGIYEEDKREDIENRRTKESEFLSKKKDAQVAYEEQKQAEEEAKLAAEKGGKKPAKPAAKKNDKKPALKKGELPPLSVPAREILEHESKLGFKYLIDFTIEEYIKHILRNIVNNRDDDIFELKPKSPEELERIQKEKEEREKEKLEQEKNPKKKPGSRQQNSKEKKASEPASPEETNIDFYSAYDPYNANHVKEFISPLSQKQTKLLTEENAFNFDNIFDGFNKIFEMLTDKIASTHKDKVEEEQKADNEKREEALTELDINLKSLAPRKGKIEVEEYDRRAAELEKHETKYKKHVDNILESNKQDGEKHAELLQKLQGKFDELSKEYETLYKGIEEEETNKGLEDKFKKFKTSYYNFISEVNDIEKLLENYSKKNPNDLLNLDKNFLANLKLIANGGTYSEREVEVIKENIKKLEEENITNQVSERQKAGDEKLKEVREKSEEYMTKLEKLYADTLENINAKECIGKKFGAPKRIVNGIIINIKIKCNQAKEGLDNNFKNLVKIVKEFNSLKVNELDKLNEILNKNELPLLIRKELSKINLCVYNYGKYINAFKEIILNSYNLSRVLMKEDIESCEIVEKADLDADEALKKEEMMSLGFLGQILLENSEGGNTGAAKGKNANPVNGGGVNFENEISGIEDVAKSECAKIYVGNFAKFLNPAEKMPDNLVEFLKDIKLEMELLRLNCVRELRTFCQELYKFSIDIPKCVMKFIYAYSQLTLKNENEKLMTEFDTEKNSSEKIKNQLNSILGPYLSNPYYGDDLNKIETQDNTRNNSLINKINTTQFSLIEFSEGNSKKLITRILNNFESLLTLFDNFIFEEEFISLGDDEYFKKRQNYNELLKLKSTLIENANAAAQAGGKNQKNTGGGIDASNYNLDSKRTFKKIYKGINFTTGKINYYDRFTESVCNVVENSEEKIKLLETEYKKENFSKSITGIKLQNNKNLFLERNLYYDSHCKDFNEMITNFIQKFNNERLEEMEYKKKWNGTLEQLKQGVPKEDVKVEERPPTEK